ncbi:MAG: MmcB family DNA repair protein [Gammaproteobacteria bacterium]|nr:MmcB family DNA repair protein [Gammaproteobacteria bacterium]
MITAYDIQALLRQKHSKDIYVSECKNGQSYVEGLLKLDGLAIARSYANPMVTGYEIKVSRSDFMQDEKWHHYLKYCNCFYFVCPTGLIDSAELPENIGPYWTSKNGKRLYKKKKAAYIGVDIPADIYKYILISRAEIKESNHYYTEESKAEFWENWLSSKKYYAELGYKVSKSLQKMIREKIELVSEENRRLVKENEEYAVIKQILTNSGINTARTWNLKYDVEDRLKELKSMFPPKMEENLDMCISQLTQFSEAIKKPR